MALECRSVFSTENVIFYVSLDINECMNIPSPCHINATCNDTDGSYVCTCIDGYSGDGTTNCTSTFFVRVTFSFYVNERYFYVNGLYLQPLTNVHTYLVIKMRHVLILLALMLVVVIMDTLEMELFVKVRMKLNIYCVKYQFV